MTPDVKTSGDASVTSLVSGIINDAQDLFKQQAALLKSELKQEMNKTLEAVLALAIGAGIALLGLILLTLMLVYLLHWAAPNLDLWACYGIVAVAFLALGGILLYTAKARFASIHPVPDQSVQALKENAQWLTNPK